MLVDYLAEKLFAREYDKNGRLAMSGKADYPIINRILSRKYFSIKGPKSTGREVFGKSFGERFLSLCRKKALSKSDILATASILTVKAVKHCAQINNLKFDEIIIAGGGAGNDFFIKTLIKVFPETKITASIDYGYPRDYLEAVSFAVLANEALCSNRYQLKNATGAKEAVVLGKICQP